MSDLFRHLVERSVRGQSVAARSTVADAGDTLERGQSEAEHAPGTQRDAIQPRQRSRYERRPQPEPVHSDAVAHEDESRPSLPQPTSEPPLRNDPAERPAANPATRAPSARPANESPAASSRTADEKEGRESIEHVQRREASPDTPRAAEPSMADEHAPATPRIGPRAVAEPRAAPTADLHDRDRPPPAQSVASPQPQKVFQPNEPHNAAAESVPRPQPVNPRGSPVRPRAGNVTASTGSPRAIEQPASQAGKITPLPVQQASRQRETPRPATPVPARPAVEQASAPRVHINIGRVEVRAVYASPPSPARQPSSTPSMSLNDYLKQRDGS